MNDFFITWSKQSGTPLLPIKSSRHDEYVLQNGNPVFDFVSTSFQANFGHSHPRIIEQITSQLGQLPIASPKAVFDLKPQVTTQLLDLLKLPHGKIFYTVSGAESVENALKICRQVTGKKMILARKASYHGATLGAMSVSGDWRSDAHVNFSEGTVRIPEPVDDPDLSRTAKIIEQTGPQNIAAVIIETVSGVNGVVIPPQSWLDKIQNLCADNNIYYIADEVLCGFGRSGKNFAFQNFNLKPDLVCMSKGITGGYIPFGAVWVSNDIAKYYDQNVLACGLTSYAHPLGLAALDAVSEILNDVEFKTSLQQLQQTFADSIDRLARQHSATAYRRQGLLAAIEFGDRTLPPWTHFIEHGLLVFTKANMLILAPPLVTKPARLQQAFDQLGQSLTQ